MKKVINGKMYNTSTATLIGYEVAYDSDWMHRCREELYRKTTGECFLYGDGGPATRYGCTCSDGSMGAGQHILPLSESEAREWVEENLSTAKYIELFGEPAE